MNLSKIESGRIGKKLDKVDEFTKRIDKEIEDIKNILREATSNNEPASAAKRSSRRKTPQKTKKHHSGAGRESDDEESDN
jgi:hypothetical protein